MEITFKIIPNLPENRDKLEYGDAYGVLYFDEKKQEKRMGIGVWKTGRFSFPTFKTRSEPKMGNILGWYHVKSWRET